MLHKEEQLITVCLKKTVSMKKRALDIKHPFAFATTLLISVTGLSRRELDSTAITIPSLN